MWSNFCRIPLYLAATVLLVACGTPTTPEPSQTTPPGPSPAPTAGAGAYVATFQVEAESYRILLTDPADIEVARRLLNGEEAPSIPNGLIVRGDPGVNTDYSWHIDSASVEFVDVTIEVCDGLPSHVEDGTLEGDRYCPWGARVVDLQPAEHEAPAD